MLQSFLVYVIALFWALINILKTTTNLIQLGPRIIFEKKEKGRPPADLKNPLYGEHNYLNIGAIKIHYVVSGPVDAPLMLMVHGFPESWFTWRYQIKEFQKDFRVIAMDMRGFGDTDKPRGADNYKLEHLVKDLELFIGGLGYKSCVLVSHDWGGAVCWEFAARHPHMVDRLVVMNIPPVAVWHAGFTSLRRPLQFLSSWYIYFFQLPLLPELGVSLQDCNALKQMYQEPPMGLCLKTITEEEMECCKYYFRQPGAWTAGINYYRANFLPLTPTCDLEYPMPVHIIWGCKDKALTLQVLEDTLLAVPVASVTRLEDASHWVQVDDPGRVNSSIRSFLETTHFMEG